MCQPRKLGTVGAEPFSAKLRYTGAEDSEYANLIKLTVTMPHIDGERIISPLAARLFAQFSPSERNTSHKSPWGKKWYSFGIYVLFAVKTKYYGPLQKPKSKSERY